MASAGIQAVGLSGVATTLANGSGMPQLNGSWSRVPLEGRNVTILFDAGRASNAQVARAQSRLTLALERAGATVRVAALPLADGKDQGPDDFHHACGAEALREVIDAAVPANPLARLEQTEDSANLLDDLSFMISVVVRGSATEAKVRDAYRAAKATTPFNGALRKVKKLLKEADTTSDPVRDGTYETVEGRLCLVGSDGHPRRLGNFDARIVREIELVEDEGITRRVTMRATLETGEDLGEHELQFDSLRNDLWPTMAWGTRVVVESGWLAKHVFPAMQQLSTFETERVYQKTGWHETDGRPVFLHAGGAVGAERVSVQLGDFLDAYRLPSKPEELQDAVRASLKLLDAESLRVTVPLLAATYRAPTLSLLPHAALLHLFGTSGAYKTTLVQLAAAHFGDFTRRPLTGWSSTAATIEFRAHRAKDVILALDDWVPRTADSRDPARTLLETVVRAIGNGSARGRMRRDLSARADRPPRALLVSTGEEVPSGQSTLARTILLQVRKGDVDLGVVTTIQQQADRLPHAMRGYIEWLAGRYDELGDRLPKRLVELRNDFGLELASHPRAPEATASLMLGLELFVRFAVDAGAVQPDEGEGLLREGRRALMVNAVVQAEWQQTVDPVDLFLAALRSLLDAGEVTLKDSDGVVRIGAAEGPHVFLIADVAYREASKFLQSTNRVLPVSPRTLWQRLNERGLLLVQDHGRLTIKRNVGGRRVRVLVLSRDLFEDVPDPINQAGRFRNSPGQPGHQAGRV